MTNFDRTAAWLAACGKQPGNAEHISTQMGADLEEIAEYLENVRVSKEGWARLLERVVTDLHSLAAETLRGDVTLHLPQHLLTPALDALCDREVTANGVAYLTGFQKNEADREVLRANDSKFNADGTPFTLPGGKIGKALGYVAPHLQPFIRGGSQ